VHLVGFYYKTISRRTVLWMSKQKNCWKTVATSISLLP